MDKYKQYEDAKRDLQSKHLTAKEYQEAVKRIAKKYGI